MLHLGNGNISAPSNPTTNSLYRMPRDLDTPTQSANQLLHVQTLTPVYTKLHNHTSLSHVEWFGGPCSNTGSLRKNSFPHLRIYVTVVYPRESSDHISDRAPPHLAILAENMLWPVDNLGWLCHVFEEIYQLFNDSWLLDVTWWLHTTYQETLHVSIWFRLASCYLT